MTAAPHKRTYATMQSALAELDVDNAISELASGTLSKEIAARYGVTAYAVRKRLAKHPDYAQAIKDQAESFVEDAVDEVRALPLDNVAIARARARADVALKWAAARDPQVWGAKPDLGGLTVQVQVVAFGQRNEGECIESVLCPTGNVAHQQHLQRLASLSPEQLAALVALADQIGAGRDGSPVAPRLVDSGGDQSASVVSQTVFSEGGS